MSIRRRVSGCSLYRSPGLGSVVAGSLNRSQVVAKRVEERYLSDTESRRSPERAGCCAKPRQSPPRAWCGRKLLNATGHGSDETGWIRHAPTEAPVEHGLAAAARFIRRKHTFVKQYPAVLVGQQSWLEARIPEVVFAVCKGYLGNDDMQC